MGRPPEESAERMSSDELAVALGMSVTRLKGILAEGETETPPEGTMAEGWTQERREAYWRELAELRRTRDEHDQDDEPCTCTLACIPQGLVDGQVCRLAQND